MSGTENLMKSRFLDRQIRCELHENSRKSNSLPVLSGVGKKGIRAIGKISNTEPPLGMKSSMQN